MRRQQGNPRSRLAGSLNKVAGLAPIRGDLLIAAPLYEEAVRSHRAWATTTASRWASSTWERRREAIGPPIKPVDRPVHEQRIAAVRAALGDDGAFDLAPHQGRSISLDEALLAAASIC